MLMELDRMVSISLALVLHCYAKRLRHKTRATVIQSEVKPKRNQS